MLFSISAKTMFCRQSENGECQVCLILEYRRLHDKIARLVSGGAEKAGMKGCANTRREWSVSKANEVSEGGCCPLRENDDFDTISVAPDGTRSRDRAAYVYKTEV